VKDVDFDKHSFYVATSNGLYVVPFLDSTISLERWVNQKKRQFPSILLENADYNLYLMSVERTRAVRFVPEDSSLLVAFKNGFFQINRNGTVPLKFDKRQVFVSSLWYKNGQLFIGTFSDGLYIKEKEQVDHFTVADLLVSNTLLKLKATENYLWLMAKDAVQLFDINNNKVIHQAELPDVSGSNVFDVAEKQGTGFMATAEGLYRISVDATRKASIPPAFLDFVVVNNSDTATSTGIAFSYLQNDLQFHISTPALSPSQDIHFKYRLVGASDEWMLTEHNERVLRFASLMPGSYRFEAMAVNNAGIVQGRIIAFPFEIQKPWWGQLWFYLLMALLLIMLIYAVHNYRMRQILELDKVRGSISRDLHDDMGATLSSINIYSSMVRKEKGDSQYVDLIQYQTKELISKIDDLVWSTNPKNDSVGQLLKRMALYAEPFLEARGIACHFEFDEQISEMTIDLLPKRNLYLVFKELINNVVKHSEARNCWIELRKKSAGVLLSVTDDGKGLDPEAGLSRNGLKNIQARMTEIGGNIRLNATEQGANSITITIPTKR
jgi:signal transduction histidine kinase